jgi:Tfp pilus assembly protein PilN
MAQMKGPNNTVLGLFVDGLDVKLAILNVGRKRISVQELRTATLVSKLEERKLADLTTAGFGDTTDTFSMPAVTEGIGGESGEDNGAVFLGLLAQYPTRKYSLTYSISEPAIYYHLLESDFGLKGKKLKERILSELRNIRAFQPAPDAVDSIVTDEGNLLCVVREDGLSIINTLENVKGYLGNRLPKIAGIDSSDIALMNMVRLNYDIGPGDMSVIIYVGVEFTRLIFMRGNHFYQFAPILGEGYDSPNVQNTIYSRLLLEQDNLAIPRINRIILAGESKRIGLKDFLEQQLPDQEVDYLIAPRLDLSALPLDQQESVSEFAVPIGAAWKVLDEDNKNVYKVNLLPADVREGQRVFKLAWHGYLLIALLFMSALFFTWQISMKSREIDEQAQVLQLKQSQMEENRTLMTSIEGLQAQLARYQTSLALYDTLVPGSDKWSKALTQLSHGVEDLNSIWLTDFTSNDVGAVTLSGFSIYRTRIPRLSTLFDNSVLKEVTVTEIREQTVYNYKIEVPPSLSAPAAKTSQ